MVRFQAWFRGVCADGDHRVGGDGCQIVWKSVHGSRDIEHVSSAHSPAEVEVLKTAAVQRIAAGQDPLPLDQPAVGGGPGIQVVGMRMGLLLDAIACVIAGWAWFGPLVMMRFSSSW